MVPFFKQIIRWHLE